MNILSHISSLEDYKFISKFKSAFENNNIICTYVTTNVEAWFRLKLQNENVKLVKKQKTNSTISDSFNEKAGFLKSKDASITYFSFLSWVEKYYQKYNWDLIIIPSGRMISHQALTDFAKKENIKTVYIGYGNFHGKTILDPIGTDKNSSLYTTPEILDQWDVPEDEYQSWKKAYLLEKESNTSIPQAREVNLGFIFKRFVRTVICKIDNIFNIAHDIDYQFSELKKTFFLPNENINIKPIDINSFDQKFIFFAMQLSSDTQIIQNYSHDVFHALDSAINIAKSKNLPLVVKSHPAEISKEVANHLSLLAEKKEIILTFSNTITVIKKSGLVIVVNSTVGLEAKILGREVLFLGNTFFKHLDEKRVRAYILRYLFNIHYFDSEQVDNNEIIKIYNRLIK